MKKSAPIRPVLALLGLLLQGPLLTSAHADDAQGRASVAGDRMPGAPDMSGMSGMPADKHTTMSSHKGQGSINKIDIAAGAVNLTHGPIKSLGWMGMTMDFKVKNKAHLDKIKVGMKVNFEISKESDGTFVITTITPVK